MTEKTTRLALPYLQVAQAKKEVTHNEALKRLDLLVQCKLESRTLAEPPIDAGVGGLWYVPVGATGAWSGRDGQVAESVPGSGTSTWRFVDLVIGMTAYIVDEDALLFFDGMSWREDGLPVKGVSVSGRTMLTADPVAVQDATGGSLVDNEARAALGQLLANLRALGLVAAA
ncbi:MAG: DUF2793 domain-containing protein [Pacificimonas sp.]